MGKRFTDDDIAHLYNLVTEQMQEDRASINDVFEEIREYVKEHQTRWVDLGEVVAKLGDLRLKQTGQIIEVLRIIEKVVPKDNLGDFSDEEKDFINNAVSKALSPSKKDESETSDSVTENEPR